MNEKEIEKEIEKYVDLHFELHGKRGINVLNIVDDIILTSTVLHHLPFSIEELRSRVNKKIYNKILNVS